MKATFKDTNRLSRLEDSNELYDHYFNPSFKFRYDSNFFDLKFAPGLQEFKLLEVIQLAFAENHDLDHIKFYWPENTPVHHQILQYFDQYDYQLELIELFQIVPDHFFTEKLNSSVKIEEVNASTLEAFKQLSYTEDQLVSTDFAMEKAFLYDNLFLNDNTHFYLAKLEQEYVGAITVYESKHFLEIDDLMTLTSYRKQGIATCLQNHVMKQAMNLGKEVILLVDADDTPRNMYLQQGYQNRSFRVGALCEREDW